MVCRIRTPSRYHSSWCFGMSKPITCAMCGTMVDDSDTVPMPNGAMCLDPCYLWLERMMDEDDPYDDDDEIEIIFVFEGEEETGDHRYD